MKNRIVKKYDNGLVLVYKRNTSRNAVFFDIRFKSGLNNDPEDKLGLAHLAEHCLCFSNNKYTLKEKTEKLSKLFYANFATSRTSLRLYAYVSDEEFEDTFEYFSNCLSDVVIPEEEFTNEKQVVNQEILRFRKNLAAEMDFTHHENLFEEKVPIRVRAFGTTDTVAKIESHDVKDYLLKCLTLSNCQITVYGNVSLLRVKKAIKKYLLSSLNTTSDKQFLGPNEVIKYSANKPSMIVNKSPDDGKSKIEIYHKVSFDNLDRLRGYATSILSSIFETAAKEFFRDKYGLCYASRLRFKHVLSLDNKYDIATMTITIECDQDVVKKVLEVLPEFYSFLNNYKINDSSTEEAKTILRRYEKCVIGKDYVKKGESLSNSQFYNDIYYTYWQNLRYKRQREKITTEFIKNIFKSAIKEQPFIFVVSNTEEELPTYKKIIKDINRNLKWLNDV